MGVVYLAEDTKLARTVALKVLPAELAESESRRKRFEREAKAVAALNHPNIVTVYSVEEDGGVHFITMELVHGKTLADVLSQGALSSFGSSSSTRSTTRISTDRGLVSVARISERSPPCAVFHVPFSSRCD